MVSTHGFTARLWLYPGEGGWVFATLPAETADQIVEEAPARRGFGSVRVEVTIGDTTWRTSVFPDKESASFLLPVKRAVRESEGLEVGDATDFSLRLVAAD